MQSFTPSLNKKEFIKLSTDYSIIPLYGESLLDLETPVSTFMKLDYHIRPYSFLLESVVNGEIRGRYSFLGGDPFQILEVSGSHYKFFHINGKGTSIASEGGKTHDPLSILKGKIKEFGKAYQDERLPSFVGGAVGFLCYDIIRYYEKIPDKNPDSLKIPEMVFMFTNELILFDHIDHKIKVLVNIFIKKKHWKNLPVLYDKTIKIIEKKFQKINQASLQPLDKKRKGDQDGKSLKLKSLLTKEEFKKRIKKAKEYINQGDIFQVVLSNRFTFKNKCDHLTLYRALRSINPSPYLFFYRFNQQSLIGSSPEIMVKTQGRLTEIRPIAGTRPRGKNAAEDLLMEKNLLADEKEIAEHIMLVDLARNDLGRISEKGTVKVAQFKTIEKYSHVMHIVSSCIGQLKENLDATDALRVSLPAGTLSGAPKIRAMEIIDELEEIRRSFYGGALGYISYNGDMDTAILIRTLYAKNKLGVFQVGAGIVFDSNPENEFQEIMNKAEALKQAIILARRGLRI